MAFQSRVPSTWVEVTKVAVDEGLSTDAKVNMGLAGASMAAPFMGLIGESRITQDPYYNKNIPRMDSKALGQMAQPGDVLLTSTREGAGYYKKPQVMATGSEFYHAEPVLHGGDVPITTEAGAFSNSPDSPETLLNKKRGTPMRQRVGSNAMYEDAVLMRPKKGMSPAEQQKMQTLLATGAKKEYGKGLATRAFLRDIFMPKIKGVTDRIGPKGPACAGEMCSTLPAGVHKEVAGGGITRGKHVRSTLPADFMRADSPYEAVGSSLKNTKALGTKKQRLLRRLGGRAAIGGAIAGTGLLAYNEPEALLGIGAGAAAPIGARMALDKAMETNVKNLPEGSIKRRVLEIMQKPVHAAKGVDTLLPPVPWIMEELSDIKAGRQLAREAGEKYVIPASTKKYLKNFLRNTGGVAVGAGLGAYGLSKLISSRFKNDEGE